MNTVKPMYEWNEIPWRKLERNVFKLQKRIYKASRRGDVRTVRRLQKLLTKSWASKCLAVRRVTQDNQGKKTAGVDGVKSLTPKQRLYLVNKLKLSTKVKPTRRVWIPKPNGEKRPLGIPTIYDRALQALIKLAIEPEWEAKFEPNSYGFRPARSSHDAIGSIFNALKQKSRYVLDADIEKCFDKINHERLLEKLNTYPSLRRQIRAWLQAGYMDGQELFPTLEGTPQGGVISPLLANIALHGMEEMVQEEITKYKLYTPEGNLMSKTGKRKSVILIRYADDLVLLHENFDVVRDIKQKLEKWLGNLGLKLKESKTRICHSLEEHDGQKAGFDFLGFHIQQRKAGKFTSSKNGQGKTLGFKTIITPSNDSIKSHNIKLKRLIRRHCAVSQTALINHLNPVIRGWCNYYSHVVSTETFSKLDHLLFWKLFRWGKRRHNNKSAKWVKSKYFKNIDGKSWVFTTREGKNPMRLLSHMETKINRFVKVKGDSSPYDGNLLYWSSRMGKHPEMPKRTASLLKKQKGKCAHCGLFFKDGDIIEIDHIIPKSQGGKDEYKNYQLLHRHCHDEKSKGDGSYQAKSIFQDNYQWIDDLLVMC